MRRTNKLLRALKGWEFDVKRLMETERGSGGAFLSPPKVTRGFRTKFSINLPNLPTNGIIIADYLE